MKQSNKILYKQDDFPVFQNRMYETKGEAINCVKVDIRLVEDSETGLIYNSVFDQALMKYDETYQNEQAISAIFKKHLDMVLDIVVRLLGRSGLVEVGCGKAYFLELLQSKGIDITGFDPSYEGINPAVKKHYFRQGVNVQADGVILRHVLEHINDPVKFLQELCVANYHQGKIYIEVPSFDWIVDNNAWTDIFYEHANYFRLTDFHRMFSNITESGSLFGGQYIYVVAELNSLRKPVINISQQVILPFNMDYEISKITKYIQQNKTIVVWGGASKGVIFSLLMNRFGFKVDMVIDINQAKQDKFLPITGLQVKSPEYAMTHLPKKTIVFIMNENYLDEIKEISNNKYMYITIGHLEKPPIEA